MDVDGCGSVSQEFYKNGGELYLVHSYTLLTDPWLP